jgi:hypothetical protein
VSEYLRFLRFYFVLLAIFTVGRFALGFSGEPYANAHQVFSIVILTVVASLHHAAFARRFKGYGLKRAIGLTATLAVVSQLVILVSTALSYLLGIETYFNAPQALNVPAPIPFGQAMLARAGGLVVNTAVNAILGALGWALGAALPKD